MKIIWNSIFPHDHLTDQDVIGLQPGQFFVCTDTVYFGYYGHSENEVSSEQFTVFELIEELVSHLRENVNMSISKIHNKNEQLNFRCDIMFEVIF